MPPNLPNPMQMARALKQLQKFQEELQRLQQELAERTVEGSAGGGAVRAEMDGSLRLRSLRIDPSVVQAGDVEMLQDLVIAAVNEAMRQARAMSEREMARLTSQLGLGGLPGMPPLG